MFLSKVISIVTPLMLMALIGVVMIVYGLLNTGQENNILQFFFGIPIALGFAGMHFLIRRVLERNNLRIWILETLIVAALWLIYPHL
ncbi:hypothetical protein [Larkinella sp. C7]|jgi:hypothetical protein|uniref:hypothetical protein n=1 Tax=Larkinella sp. C7 TaxID=2576607 RepID=UPI001110FE2B|nr:hypothetical protein [Larkinella sp. C7]